MRSPWRDETSITFLFIGVTSYTSETNFCPRECSDLGIIWVVYIKGFMFKNVRQVNKVFAKHGYMICHIL